MKKILIFIYDILFLLGFILYLPVYLWRKKISWLALRQKFGFLIWAKQNKTIWIHVVSVGEAQLIAALIKRLKEELDHEIVISTTTLTGNTVARQNYSQDATVIFFPYDISWIVKRVIRLINPEIFVAVETEIWPNLFYHLKKKDIPIIIINGRISDKAYQQYLLVWRLMKPIVNLCDFICVQNQYYQERFRRLGAELSKLRITGNLKFESITVDEEKLSHISSVYTKVLKPDNAPLFLAASTHHPEEEMILTTYIDIIKKVSDLNLLIAPRYIDRVESIEKSVRSVGLNPVRISQITQKQFTKNSVFILDAMGQLLYFCAVADVCFVGGSLNSHGGHNILEPIFFGKPTMFGPSMQNFPDIEREVLNHKAGIKVVNTRQLKEETIKLLTDSSYYNKFRYNSKMIFEEENRGLDETITLIKALLTQ